MSNEELPAWTARPPEPTRQALEYWNERVRLVEELRQWESPAAEPPDGDVLAWKTRRDEIARLRQELHALDYPDPAAQAEQAPAKPVIHKTRHGDPLKRVITMARQQALNPDDWTSVWAALVVLAESPSRPAPLLGYDKVGVKYKTFDVESRVRWLTREAFRRRGRSLK